MLAASRASQHSHCCFRARADAELAEDVLGMVADRVWAHEEGCGDRLVGAAFDQKSQDPTFFLGQGEALTKRFVGERIGGRAFQRDQSCRASSKQVESDETALEPVALVLCRNFPHRKLLHDCELLQFTHFDQFTQGGGEMVYLGAESLPLWLNFEQSGECTIRM